MVEQQEIAVLGSTGSVGQQALQVVQSYPDLFNISVLTAQNNVGLLIEQAKQFSPKTVVIVNEKHHSQVRDALSCHNIKVYSGRSALNNIHELCDYSLQLNALLGLSGLEPCLNAIQQGKKIALANKECLVIGGHLIMTESQKHDNKIIPVDSEHSAIFQCLRGEDPDGIEKVFLTASGGPFRDYSKQQMRNVTAQEALNHPNWNMGKKISIDSATMMNKGMEAIAAKWLFGLNTDQIRILIHPQSVVHSMVQFVDGTLKAQLSMPDMRLPILYALTHPSRTFSKYRRLNFDVEQLFGFKSVNTDAFPCLKLACEAMNKAGNLPCCLSAANDIAVAAFLNSQIGFLQIPLIIELCIKKCTWIENPSLDDIFETDKYARINAQEAINTILSKNH